jgi:hypothetical protein
MSKIVEIVDPVTNKKGYYDFGTTNLSFLETARELKDLGIKRWYQCLEVKYPQFGVQDLDPYSDDLTSEQIGYLVLEAKNNVWFYMRRIVRVPAKGAPKPYQFYLHRASHATIWCYIHSIDVELCQPRQTYKTTTAIALMQHSFIYDQHNINIPFLHIKDSEAVRNAGMLRDYIEVGPKWANPWINCRKLPGLKSLKYEAHGTTIAVKASSDSPDKARDLLRGDTIYIAFIDEWEYIPYINNVVEGAGPAMVSARTIARENNGRTCILYTSTPGNPDTAAGKASKRMIDATPRFSERFYDLSDDQLTDLFEGTTGSENGNNGEPITAVYIEFDYKQLRKSEEWLREQYELAVRTGKMDEYRLGILLQRVRTGDQVLFRQEDIDFINDHVVKHDYEILLINKYILYIFKHEVHNVDLMSDNQYFDIDIPYLVGIDIAAGTGGDNTAITIVHPYTLKIVAECKSPYMGPFDLMRVITELARMLPRCLFCPEANGVGKPIMDFFQEGSLIGRVYHDPRLDISKNAQILDPIQTRLKEQAIGRQYIGTNVSPTVRESMMTLLKTLVRDHREKLNTPFLVQDLNSLTIFKTGKIAAEPGAHDDCVMSYLHTVFVLFYGKDLNRFGINTQLCKFESSKKAMYEYETKQREDVINNMIPTIGHEEQMRLDIIKANKTNDIVDDMGYTRAEYAGVAPVKDDPYARKRRMEDLQFLYDVNQF